jgi:hypothetical protein
VYAFTSSRSSSPSSRLRATVPALSIRDFGLDNLPSHGFHANWAYLLITLLAYNLLTWLKLLALPAGERASYAKRLRFRFLNVAASVGRSGRRLVLRLSAS